MFLQSFITLFLSLAFAQMDIRYATEDDRKCTSGSGKRGVCVELNQCPEVRDVIGMGVQPTHCGFRGHTPIVCCPTHAGLVLDHQPLTVPPPYERFHCGFRDLLTEFDLRDPFEVKEVHAVFVKPEKTDPVGKPLENLNKEKLPLEKPKKKILTQSGSRVPSLENPEERKAFEDVLKAVANLQRPNAKAASESSLPVEKQITSPSGKPEGANSPPGKPGEIPPYFEGGDRPITEFPLIRAVNAIENSWPWMALLGRAVGRDEMYFCSGSLLNHRFVVTAAHCVLDPSPLFVRLGEHDYSTDDEQFDFPVEDVDVDDVIFHPKYVLDRGYHDVALLKLARNVTFRKGINPICLPWGDLALKSLINEQVTLTGWGNTAFNGRPSLVLQEVNVTVFDPAECRRSYSTLRDYGQKFPEGMDESNILCAGDREENRDSCEGDSGGPLMHYNALENSFTLDGIISTGYGCGLPEFPGLYAPLRNYETLLWIRDVAFHDF